MGLAIKSRFNAGKIIYQSQAETLRGAILEAVAAKADLRGADDCERCRPGCRDLESLEP